MTASIPLMVAYRWITCSALPHAVPWSMTTFPLRRDPGSMAFAPARAACSARSAARSCALTALPTSTSRLARIRAVIAKKIMKIVRGPRPAARRAPERVLRTRSSLPVIAARSVGSRHELVKRRYREAIDVHGGIADEAEVEPAMQGDGHRRAARRIALHDRQLALTPHVAADRLVRCRLSRAERAGDRGGPGGIPGGAVGLAVRLDHPAGQHQEQHQPEQ